MAIIKCPECGNFVSDKALVCPHCGKSVSNFYAQNDGERDGHQSPLSQSSDAIPVDVVNKDDTVASDVGAMPTQTLKKGKVFILVIFAVLTIGAGLAFFISKKPFSADKRVAGIQRLIDNQKYKLAEDKCESLVRSFTSLTNGQRKSLVNYYKSIYEHSGDKSRYNSYLKMLLDLNDHEVSSYLFYGFLNDVVPLSLEMAKARYSQGDIKNAVVLCEEAYGYSVNLNTEDKCNLGSLFWALGLSEFDSHLLQKGLSLANQGFSSNKDSAMKTLSDNDKLYCTGLASNVRTSVSGSFPTSHLVLEGCLSDGKKNYNIEMDLEVEAGGGERAVIGTYRYLSKPADARLKLFGTSVYLNSSESELTVFCSEGVERFDLVLDEGLNMTGSWRQYKNWNQVKAGGGDYLRKLKVSLRDKNGIESGVLRLLRTVYPNSLEWHTNAESVGTNRFWEYSSEECDYDPLYQTQESYSYGILPEPKFTKITIPGIENTYKVEWQLKYGDEIIKKSVVLVIVREGDQFKIDNIWNEFSNSLLFDYSKPAEPWYG